MKCSECGREIMPETPCDFGYCKDLEDDASQVSSASTYED